MQFFCWDWVVWTNRHSLPLCMDEKLKQLLGNSVMLSIITILIPQDDSAFQDLLWNATLLLSQLWWIQNVASWPYGSFQHCFQVLFQAVGGQLLWYSNSSDYNKSPVRGSSLSTAVLQHNSSQNVSCEFIDTVGLTFTQTFGYILNRKKSTV